jgi:outer membrane protein assembly factor BamB
VPVRHPEAACHDGRRCSQPLSTPMTFSLRSVSRAAVLAVVLPAAALLPAQAWPNYGGGPARNGLSDRYGPTAADQLWSNTTDFSVIAWHPFCDGERVYTVRQSGFPGATANDAILALDRRTGVEVWRTTLGYSSTATDWIAWIGGVSNGRLIVSRSDNQRSLPLQALDAATGAPLWTSQISTFAWAHDGIVFLDDGDLIVGDRQILARIDGATGATVWSTPRNCAVSGTCGAARFGDALYIDEVAPGGQIITRIDAATGARDYSSPVMSGFTAQNAPFVSPDGSTVYYARTQNNPSVDMLHAFVDTGTGFVPLWNRPVRWTTRHEHGIAQNGTIYTFLPGDEFVGLDPGTGNVLHTAGTLSPIGTNLSPQTVVARDGNVYVSNGWASSPASDGRVWAFGPTLGTPLFTLNLDRQNAGGPVLAGQGELVVADRTGVYAYRVPGPAASSTQRFGTGVNAVAFTTVQEAELYGAFRCQVEVTPQTAVTFVIFGILPLAPTPLFQGELLVDLGFVLIDPLPVAAGGVHTLPLPGDPAALGLGLTAQGARIGGAGIEFGNAIDFVIGY